MKCNFQTFLDVSIILSAEESKAQTKFHSMAEKSVGVIYTFLIYSNFFFGGGGILRYCKI